METWLSFNAMINRKWLCYRLVLAQLRNPITFRRAAEDHRHRFFWFRDMYEVTFSLDLQKVLYELMSHVNQRIKCLEWYLIIKAHKKLNPGQRTNLILYNTVWMDFCQIIRYNPYINTDTGEQSGCTSVVRKRPWLWRSWIIKKWQNACCNGDEYKKVKSGGISNYLIQWSPYVPFSCSSRGAIEQWVRRYSV